jgi:uncharacterized protein (TIGR02996 family)
MTEQQLKDAEPFLRDIIEHRGDPSYRLAFANWLESRGHFNAASGQRWKAVNPSKYTAEITQEQADSLGIPEAALYLEIAWLGFSADPLMVWTEDGPCGRMGPNGPILTPEMRAKGVVIHQLEAEEPWQAAVRTEIERGVLPYLTAVIERPRDTVTWQALADWLDEQGHWLGPLIRAAVDRSPDYPTLFGQAAAELIRRVWVIDGNLASGGGLTLHVSDMQLSPREFPASARIPAIVLLANCYFLGLGWGWFSG